MRCHDLGSRNLNPLYPHNWAGFQVGAITAAGPGDRVYSEDPWSPWQQPSQQLGQGRHATLQSA